MFIFIVKVFSFFSWKRYFQHFLNDLKLQKFLFNGFSWNIEIQAELFSFFLFCIGMNETYIFLGM